MTRLLSEGFAKVKNSLRFWVCTALIAALSLMVVIMEKFSEVMHEEAPQMLLSMLSMQPLFMAIVPAMLLVRDFTQNTVRNKIICGHTRTGIYLAHLIIFDAVALFYHTVSMLVGGCAGALLLGGGSDITSEWSLYYIGVSYLLVLAYASMTVFICMIVRGISGVIIAYIFNSLLAMFGGLAIFLVKDADFIKLMSCVLLDMQASYVIDGMADLKLPGSFKMYGMPLASLAYIVVLPIIGISQFKKADLK